MKIKLTEEQYRKFVSEDTNRTNFMNKVYKEIENKDIRDVWDLIVNVYGFTVDEVIEDEMLYHLLGYKMLNSVKSWGYLGFNPCLSAKSLILFIISPSKPLPLTLLYKIDANCIAFLGGLFLKRYSSAGSIDNRILSTVSFPATESSNK